MILIISLDTRSGGRGIKKLNCFKGSRYEIPVPGTNTTGYQMVTATYIKWRARSFFGYDLVRFFKVELENAFSSNCRDQSEQIHKLRINFAGPTFLFSSLAVVTHPAI